MEVLEKIFGNATKVKIMRLFLFNQEESFNMDDIVERTKVSRDKVRKEVNVLEKIHLIKKSRRSKKPTWSLNAKFSYIKPLREFLVEMAPLKHRDILDRVKNTGQIKLIVLAGLFIQDPDSRLDMLVVGDKLNEKVLDSVVRNMEAEIGRELEYAFFDTGDFEYRLSMYDKLIRDVLDYPHEIVVNKIEDLS